MKPDKHAREMFPELVSERSRIKQGSRVPVEVEDVACDEHRGWAAYLPVMRD